MSNNYQYGENHIDALHNDTSNNITDNWQIGAQVTVFHSDGTIGYGVITGPYTVEEY